ncbi:hypothetical protein OK349_09465 [Sphingomonas sp. BT-65]|uniref:hypothetical protein n=1 Tax=Sphingomonas sp. BT-65 TaxID=2989821 RepID=UPI0022358942|nr:hypothetical protein [Sphingomonas sp. BT-65]MCW4461935.1 hypothetical protein [Sphingomonas sp. BT-65]
MRMILIALAASGLAAPALAQEREAQIADRLNDPVVQDGITAAVSSLAGILLDTRVGSLARYSDGRVRPGDTLRDVKQREDPGFERRLRRDTRRAVGTAGAVTADLAATAAALTETAMRLKTVLAPLAAAGDALPLDEYDDQD